MKKATLFAYTLCCMAFITFTFSSCKKKGTDETQPVTGANGNGSGTSNAVANISGKVTTPSGSVVGYASVFVGSHLTHSNYLGEFSLTIPAGSQTVTIQTGKGKTFKRQVPVNLIANQSFRMADSICVLTQVAQMLVIHGDYDAIEQIIYQLGYNPTVLPTGPVPPLGYLQQFSAVFLNCTNYSNMSSPYYQALDTFVMNGGSIYASDWAVEYLTGNGTPIIGGSGDGKHMGHTATQVRSTCGPSLVGGFIADSSLCTMKSGSSGYIPSVRIYDAGMIGALGKDSVDIVYDLGSWEMVNLLDAPFVTTMEKVGYPGIVAAKADMSLYYPGAGSITYTTFHNHPQTGVSPDMATLLQYYILNL